MTTPNSTVDISYTSTEASLPVASEEETVILTVYLSFCLLAVFVGNGIVFGAVFRKRYFLLFSYAVCDMVTCVTMYPLAIMVLFQGSDVSEWFCRASSCLGVSAFYSTVYILGLLAYERYHFFCRPLSYETFFTTRKLTCMVAAAWIIPLGYCIATELVIGRKVYVTSLGCRMKSSKLLSLMQIATAAAPSLLTILLSTVCIVHTWVKIRRQVTSPVLFRGIVSQTTAEVSSNANREQRSKLGAALKLIILVSGLFWGTYIPGFIAKSAVISSQDPWEVETSRNMTALYVMRYRTLVMGTVSQVLNPLLYLYTHPELRTAVKQLLGRS